MFLKSITLRKYPELDTLRLLSVTLVIGHHLFLDSNIFLDWFNNHGYVGVDIFFTLSGFIITNSLLSEYHKTNTINFKNFIIRRLLRLWPSWLFTLIISSLIVYYFGLKNPEILNELKQKFWHYFLHFGNYSHAFQGKLHTLFSHFWSLAVEEHFYLLWPSLFLFTRKNNISSIFIFFILLTVPYFFRVHYQFAGYENAVNTLSTHTRFDAIAYGCLLAIMIKKLPNIIGTFQQLLLWTLTLIILWLGLELQHTTLSPWVYQLGYSLRAIGSAFLIFAILRLPDNVFKKIWSNEILAKLGVLSYGAYLYHFIFLTIFFKFNVNLKLPQMLTFFIATTLIYLPAYLSFRFIELPFDKLKRKFH